MEERPRCHFSGLAYLQRYLGIEGLVPELLHKTPDLRTNTGLPLTVGLAQLIIVVVSDVACPAKAPMLSST